MKKMILLSLLLSLLINTNLNNVSAQESDIALGASLSEYQKEEMLMYFGEPTATDYIQIDGNKVNEYLNDGSDNSVGIFSSAKVEFMSSGFGVYVFIITPDNITEVTEDMYRNAAIVAGVNNVYIQIAAPQQVTGEGALAGVYEIFAQQGIVLNSDDIQLAERQIQIEQLLSENTDLNPSQISKLMTQLNLAVSIKLDENSNSTDEEIKGLVDNIIKENKYSFNDEIINSLKEHALGFSQSDVARNPDTRAALEATLASYEDLDDVFSKEFEVIDGTMKLNEVRILQPGEGDNFMDYPILGIWYSFTLNADAAPKGAQIAWFDAVQVIQDNNPNYTNELMVDIIPDHQYLDTQMLDIKPGGTMDMAVGYKLADDFETPIQVKFYSDLYKEKLADEIILNISGLYN